MMGLLGFLIGLTWWAMCMMIGHWIAGRFSFVSCVGVLALAWVVKSCNFARSWTFHFLQMRWQRGLFGILEFMVIDIDDSRDDDHDHDLSLHRSLRLSCLGCVTLRYLRQHRWFPDHWGWESLHFHFLHHFLCSFAEHYSSMRRDTIGTNS